MPTLTRLRPTLEVSVDFAANPTASYADIHSTDDGVVSFWRCNSTSTFLDSLGLNNGVLISTPTTTAGPMPYDTDLATTFDGTNDSAYVVSSESLSTNSGFSIDGWVKVPSYPASGSSDLIAKRGSWILGITSGGALQWGLKDDTSFHTFSSNTVLALNTWYHVACVYDDATSLLYINGVLDKSAAYASGMELGTQPVRFAAAPGTTSPTWQSSTTASGTDNVAPFNLTVTVPASTASGDLLIAHMVARSLTNVTVVITPPAGWTALSNLELNAGLTPVTEHMYYRIADGTEGASQTWVGDIGFNYAIAMTRVTGHNTVAPFANIRYGGATGTTSVTHPTGSHIPAVDANLILSLFGVRANATWTQDSGTERYDVLGASSTSISMCSQTQATAASLNVTGTSSASGVGTAHMLVIAGAVLNETACSMDDWTYWSRALDSDDVARNYQSRNGGTPSWTNVTHEVRECDTSSAERRHELDVLAAGKMGMVLREVDDKDFDPGNTSSPYLPDVEQRVRVRATWNSTTYDVFRGYADRWTPTRLGGADVEEVAFEATDGFDLLALAPVSGTIPVGYSGAHIETILSKALWPLADRDIDAGQYVMNGYTIGDGTMALALLQEIAASERGLCFIDGAGVFHYHDAAHRGSESRSTTSQATFSDYVTKSAETTEIRYQWIQPTRDKDKIVNVWTVSPDSGIFGAADQTIRDHESIAKYGLRGQSRSTRLATNSDALDQAGNLLTETAFPADRYETMRVIPLTIETYDECLSMLISDRVTVKRGFNPGWDGATMTRDYFVEGKTVHTEPDTAWQFDFVLSPVSSGNYYATIMRDGPVSYWRMDSLT